jgi:chromate transporter
MQRESTAALWVPPGATEAVPWVSPLEFSDAVALGNALPGPIAPQVSAYVGYKMAGLPGAIAAAAGTVLPSTILMLFMIVYFFKIKDSITVQSMLRAVRPVVVGLLLWTAYDMAYTVFGVNKMGFAGSMAVGWDKALFVLVAFGLLTLTKINPAFVIFGAALVGGVVYR